MYNNIPTVRLSYVSDIAEINKLSVSRSSEAAEIFRNQYLSGEIGHVEVFFTLLLNRANKVLGIHRTSMGGICGTVVDIRVVFQLAILANATSIVLCHNHPSGNLSPSEADLSLTRKIKSAGKTMDIHLNDHIILSPDGGYYSFADDGLI